MLKKVLVDDGYKMRKFILISHVKKLSSGTEFLFSCYGEDSYYYDCYHNKNVAHEMCSYFCVRSTPREGVLRNADWLKGSGFAPNCRFYGRVREERAVLTETENAEIRREREKMMDSEWDRIAYQRRKAGKEGRE